MYSSIRRHGGKVWITLPRHRGVGEGGAGGAVAPLTFESMPPSLLKACPQTPLEGGVLRTPPSRGVFLTRPLSSQLAPTPLRHNISCQFLLTTIT